MGRLAASAQASRPTGRDDGVLSRDAWELVHLDNRDAETYAFQPRPKEPQIHTLSWTSNQARGPAGFKHIIKRRKRNQPGFPQ